MVPYGGWNYIIYGNNENKKRQMATLRNARYE